MIVHATKQCQLLPLKFCVHIFKYMSCHFIKHAFDVFLKKAEAYSQT